MNMEQPDRCHQCPVAAHLECPGAPHVESGKVVRHRQYCRLVEREISNIVAKPHKPTTYLDRLRAITKEYVAADPKPELHVNPDALTLPPKPVPVPSGRWRDAVSVPTRSKGDGRVTIIVPSRSRPDLIRRSLASVLSQTLTDWQVIVVLNGPACTSPDYDAALVALQDPRIRVIRAPDLSGIAAPINGGLKLATTEFAAVLDDDDVWQPDFLFRLLGVLTSDRTLGMAYCEASHPVDDGSGRTMHHAQHPRMILTFLEAMSHYNWFGWSQAVWRRELIDGLRPEPTGCADRDAWLRVGMVAGVYHIAETLVEHHWHESNASADPDFMRSGVEWIEAEIAAGRYGAAPKPETKPEVKPVTVRKTGGCGCGGRRNTR